MLDMCKTFFFGRSKQPAILHDTRRRIVKGGIDPKCIHALIHSIFKPGLKRF